MMEIYSELVQNDIFTYFFRGMDMLYSLRYEVWKRCPYHDDTDHNIEKCLDFRQRLKSLTDMGNIQVEIAPVVEMTYRREND